MFITKPGIYKDVPIDAYHQSAGISSSGLSYFTKSNVKGRTPKDYYYEYILGNRKKPTDEMILGERVHILTLQPELWDKFYCVYSNGHKLSTTKGKELLAEAKSNAGDREIIEEKEYAKIKAMSDALLGHPVLSRLGKGEIETSLAWEHDGILLRSRPDFYSSELKVIVDIKTSSDASPKAFEKKIYDLGYYRQAAMACDGLTTLTGEEYLNVLYLVVETSPPYNILCYRLNTLAIELGRNQYMQAAAYYKECLEKNSFPGYLVLDESGLEIDPSQRIAPIDLPRWAYL